MAQVKEIDVLKFIGIGRPEDVLGLKTRSIVAEIEERYAGVSFEEHRQDKKMTTERMLGTDFPHFTEIPDLKEYVADDPEDAPIRYFHHKERAGDRIVRIASPDADKQDAFIRMPKPPEDPELAKTVVRYKDIAHVVMIDDDVLRNLHSMAIAYGPRLPIILMGEPSISKTFEAWVFGSVLETPQVRKMCFKGATKAYFAGAPVEFHETSLKYAVGELLMMPEVKNLIRAYERDYKAWLKWKRIPYERQDEIATFLSSVDRLLDITKPVTDADKAKGEKAYAPSDMGLVIAGQIIGKRIGFEAVQSIMTKYIDTDFMRTYEGGGLGILDELTRMDPRDQNVLAFLYGMAETGTPSMEVDPRRQPPVMFRHPDFNLLITANPAKFDAFQIPDTLVSRSMQIMLGGLTKDRIERLLRFQILGERPDLHVKGKTVKQAKNEKSVFKDLERMPFAGQIIDAMATLQIKLTKMADTSVISVDKDSEGGFYRFDQRTQGKMTNVLLSLRHTSIAETGTGLEAIEPPWYNILRTGIDSIYLKGIHGNVTDPNSDAYKVKAEIDALPIWKLLKDYENGLYEQVAVQTDQGVVYITKLVERDLHGKE